MKTIKMIEVQKPLAKLPTNAIRARAVLCLPGHGGIYATTDRHNISAMTWGENYTRETVEANPSTRYVFTGVVLEVKTMTQRDNFEASK